MTGSCSCASRVNREGLLEAVKVEQRLSEGREEPDVVVLGKRCFWQEKQQMQRAYCVFGEH